MTADKGSRHLSQRKSMITICHACLICLLTCQASVLPGSTWSRGQYAPPPAPGQETDRLTAIAQRRQSFLGDQFTNALFTSATKCSVRHSGCGDSWEQCTGPCRWWEAPRRANSIEYFMKGASTVALSCNWRGAENWKCRTGEWRTMCPPGKPQDRQKLVVSLYDRTCYSTLRRRDTFSSTFSTTFILGEKLPFHDYYADLHEGNDARNIVRSIHILRQFTCDFSRSICDVHTNCSYLSAIGSICSSQMQ